ncbi:MAG: hypothetical protein RSC29_06515, partial [Oscillospiraceae bacterium]
MTLIDNDKDGKVDLVKINTYKLGVVSGFNLAKETIGFKFGIPFVDLESKKYSIYKNDEKIKIEDLTQWDVTEVYESQDKESYTIKVLSKTVSGDVKGIQEEYTNANGEKVVKKATINDKVYTFSSEFETETGNKVQIGTKGTFTFDQYGQVIFLRNSGDTGESYGYVVGYSRSNGLMPKYDMKIFTARGEMDVLEVKDKLKVDGKNGKTAEYLEKVLKRVSEKPEGVNSIIKYAVNSEKKIVSVDTIEPNGAKPTSDELIKTKLDGLMRYASPANMLVSGNHNNRAVFDDNTVVFLIPDNPTSDSDYMVNSMKYFVNAAYYENLEVYDMTKNVVKVVKQKMTKKEGSYGNLDVSQSPLAIITDVATGLDAEGNEIKKLNIFVNNTESSVEIVEKTDIVQSLKEGGISKDVLKPEDLKVGDMIYYDPDLKNRANTIVRLNTDSMDKESFYITERASYTERAYGWLKEKNDGILELNIGEASTVLFNIAARNPKIYIYNLKKKSV